MAKIILRHAVPIDSKPFAIIPYGVFYNKEMPKLRKGDTIIFNPGWKREQMRLKRICRLPIASSVFTFLSKYIYGEHMTFNDFKKQWDTDCLIEGLGRDAYFTNEVFLIEVERYDNNTNKTGR